MAQRDIVVDRARAGLGHELALGQLAQRDPCRRLVRGKSVNLGEPPAAADQRSCGVEEAHALGDVLDRGLVTRRLRLEARNHRRLLAHDDVLGLDHGAAQRGEARVVVSGWLREVQSERSDFPIDEKSVWART